MNLKKQQLIAISLAFCCAAVMPLQAEARKKENKTNETQPVVSSVPQPRSQKQVLIQNTPTESRRITTPNQSKVQVRTIAAAPQLTAKEAKKAAKEKEKEAKKKSKEINTINVQINELISQISENEENLKETQKQYNKIQELVDARMLKLYATPKFQSLQILLEAKSVTDFLATYYAIQEMTKADRNLLETVKRQRDEIETTKKILEEKKKQVIASKQAQQTKTQVIANTKTMREYYISKLSSEEQKLQAKIDEYNSQVAEVDAEIKMLLINSISEDYIGGAMKWPIPGYTTVTSEYGMRVHPITGAYKLHTGTDIGAPMGADFVSAAKGVVIKATMNPAYSSTYPKTPCHAHLSLHHQK